MPKKPSTKLSQIEQRDAAGGRNHAELEVFGRSHEAAAIREQQRGERSERQPHRLADDARILRFEEQRDAAERQPFEARIDGRRDRREILLEDRDERETRPPITPPIIHTGSAGSAAPRFQMKLAAITE